LALSAIRSTFGSARTAPALGGTAVKGDAAFLGARAVRALRVNEKGRGIWQDCQLRSFKMRSSDKREQRLHRCKAGLASGRDAGHIWHRLTRLLAIGLAYASTAPSLHNISTATI
jgi:hypothetical protein